MAASESDFTGLTPSGSGVYLADEYPPLARAIQALTAFFVAKTSGDGTTEPTDTLVGISFGEDSDHFKWRVLVDGGDFLIQENIGSEGTPSWTTRLTLSASDYLEVVGPTPGGSNTYAAYFGDALTSATYGMIAIGNSSVGRSNLIAGNLDLDGTVLVRNLGAPPTSNIEYAFMDSASSIRFALAVSGTGAATYSARSMLIAGPAVLDDTIVTVAYWQGQGIFDNLACDVSGDGADLGVQNDLEVEGDIFVDSILESTDAAGVTIDSCLVKDGAAADSLLLGGVAEGDLSVADSLLLGGVAEGDLSVADSLLLGGTAEGSLSVDTADKLGGVAAASYARLDAAEEFTKAKGHTESTPSSSSNAITIDLEASNYFEIVLTEDITSITFSNTGKPGTRVIKWVQSTGGSNTITYPTAVVWPAGVAHVMTAAADSVDIVTLLVDSAGVIHGMTTSDFS